MTSTPGPDETRRDLQPHVQRLLGRCLLRIQQYEPLVKAMLAHHEFAGLVDAIEEQRAARADKFSDKPVGTLVKALFETYVVPDGFERKLLQDGQTPTDRIAMFDVWTEEGCVDALRHLEESYDRIDRHYLELTRWAKTMDEARRMTAQLTQTPERYGCRTWPQVLSESRQFDVQYRTDSDETKVAWFRERG